eukprot:scaffold31936_cov70-Phaeocystis_antarctica.AAC.2
MAVCTSRSTCRDLPRSSTSRCSRRPSESSKPAPALWPTRAGASASLSSAAALATSTCAPCYRSAPPSLYAD